MSNLENTNSINDESLSKYLKSRHSNRRSDDFPYFLIDLVGELRGGGFNTIGDVDKTLKRTKKAAELFEAENPPSRLEGSQYSAIGIVRMSMLLLDNDFFTCRPTIFNNCLPERLEKYRKHILPETGESQPMED
jgi:hypothetical protein